MTGRRNFDDRNTRWVLGIMTGMMLIGCAGCSDSGSPVEPDDGGGNDGPKTVIVNVADFAFNPSTARIMEGDTIRWVRQGGTHTTTSGTGASDPTAGDLWSANLTAQNPTFERVFDVAGDYPYFCIPHEPSMRASVEVTAR